MILIVTIGHTILNLRFAWASMAGWTLVILYEFTAGFLSETPTSILINNNFFSINTNLIGMIACYLIDFMPAKTFS